MIDATPLRVELLGIVLLASMAAPTAIAVDGTDPTGAFGVETPVTIADESVSSCVGSGKGGLYVSLQGCMQTVQNLTGTAEP